MDDGTTPPNRGRRWLVIVLGVMAVVLWLIGLALATAVLVVIGNVPGHDPQRFPRALVIAASVFTSFAIPAAAATVGWFVVRRERGRRRDV